MTEPKTRYWTRRQIRPRTEALGMQLPNDKSSQRPTFGNYSGDNRATGNDQVLSRIAGRTTKRKSEIGQNRSKAKPTLVAISKTP